MFLKKLTVPALLMGFLSILSTSFAHAQINETLCNPADSDNGFGAGTHNGHFYSWFELSQENITDCNTKISFYNESSRHFRVEWNMADSWGEDAIGGKGWGTGDSNRKIGYNVGQLTTNSPIQKALVALYGWSCYESGITQISQEYYVVDTWEGPGQFVPWDENANAPASSTGTVWANGATYDVYKVGRNGAQYCFNGSNRSFDQFWSVRRGPTSVGSNNDIDFSPHVERWVNGDMNFEHGGLNNGYQILAVEVFGDANRRHQGAIDASVWPR